MVEEQYRAALSVAPPDAFALGGSEQLDTKARDRRQIPSPRVPSITSCPDVESLGRASGRTTAFSVSRAALDGRPVANA